MRCGDLELRPLWRLIFSGDFVCGDFRSGELRRPPPHPFLGWGLDELRHIYPSLNCVFGLYHRANNLLSIHTYSDFGDIKMSIEIRIRTIRNIPDLFQKLVPVAYVNNIEIQVAFFSRHKHKIIAINKIWEDNLGKRPISFCSWS